MSFMDMERNSARLNQDRQDELEQLLLNGLAVQREDTSGTGVVTDSPLVRSGLVHPDEDEESEETGLNSDLQGALGLFAEATQDVATANVELALGRHFACADYCNQAVEKAAQAVSLLRQGHRTTYNHDLRALGAAVGAPLEVQEEMGTLSPFHPEAFYMNTPPEEADEVINATQAGEYIQIARRILRWARGIILQ